MSSCNRDTQGNFLEDIKYWIGVNNEIYRVVFKLGEVAQMTEVRLCDVPKEWFERIHKELKKP